MNAATIQLTELSIFLALFISAFTGGVAFLTNPAVEHHHVIRCTSSKPSRIVLFRKKYDKEFTNSNNDEYAPWTKRKRNKDVTAKIDEYAPWTVAQNDDNTSNNNKEVGMDDTTKINFSDSSSPSFLQQQEQLKEQEDDQPLLQTLSGGTAMIFEMARRMLVWEDVSDLMSWSNNGAATTASSSSSAAAAGSPFRESPRWHPHGGISDANPAFRTRPPAMNSQGYAATIWRNVRKRNKPSLWRHALRIYNRMSQLEEGETIGSGGSSTTTIQRSNIHYEGALLACAKLGLWHRALEIYRHVDELAQEEKNANVTPRPVMSALPPNSRHPKPSSKSSKSTKTAGAVDFLLPADPSITENMVLSLIKACVRGSKTMDSNEATLEERREPLDAARSIVSTIEERHNIPLVARHLNPLASAYQSLGLLPQSTALLKDNLADRILGPEPEVGVDPFNVHDVGAKDKASYALLVTCGVSGGDWADAVDALRDMTEAGLYPNARHLNAWTEVSERHTRQRTTRSWKKKRDEIYWLESIR